MTAIAWSHEGTERMLPESIDSATLSDATSAAVQLLELERLSLRPPSPERMPTLAELAEFNRRLDKSGGVTACWPHQVKKVWVCGASRTIRQIAWYIKEGSWAPGKLAGTCGSDRCGNPGHVVTGVADEKYIVALPPEEVAKFLGVSQKELNTLCRRLLSRKTITPKALYLLTQAHIAMGGRLP